MSTSLQKRESSRHIQNALELFAAENGFKTSECDFKIQKVNTTVKSNLNHEFELYSKERIAEFLDKERILNEHIEFQQYYNFTLFKKEKQRLKLNYTLEIGEHATNPKLVLSPDSIIPSKSYKPQELLKLLYIECNKIKAYNHILIGIFDEIMLKQLKVFVKYIYTNKFVKKVKISLYSGIEPVITRKAQLIYWFETKEFVANSQVREVDENELLIEYKKPIFGKSGLNCYGQLINAEYVNNEDDLESFIDEASILIQEDANSKKYIAKKQGYLHFTHNHLSVKNSITFDNISRNARQVASQEQNNIEVRVSQHDTDRDSVGEGVTLESESIHINGFVGAKSLLKSKILTIDGATHQNSHQFAKIATVNRHKGTLRCHHAKIKLLEGGEVHATNVEIESSLGGTIYAKNVTIGHAKNNLKVFASNSISIRLLSGEDNVLQINAQEISIIRSEIKYIEQEIENLKYDLEQAQRHHQDKVEFLKEKIENKKRAIEDILHSYKNAKITIEQPCRGLNTIVFVINKDLQIDYKTEAKAYSPFYLEFDTHKITLHPVKKTIQLPE